MTRLNILLIWLSDTYMANKSVVNIVRFSYLLLPLITHPSIIYTAYPCRGHRGMDLTSADNQ